MPNIKMSAPAMATDRLPLLPFLGCSLIKAFPALLAVLAKCNNYHNRPSKEWPGETTNNQQMEQGKTSTRKEARGE
jgi:hypothetical protein